MNFNLNKVVYVSEDSNKLKQEFSDSQAIGNYLQQVIQPLRSQDLISVNDEMKITAISRFGSNIIYGNQLGQIRYFENQKKIISCGRSIVQIEYQESSNRLIVLLSNGEVKLIDGNSKKSKKLKIKQKIQKILISNSENIIILRDTKSTIVFMDSQLNPQQEIIFKELQQLVFVQDILFVLSESKLYIVDSETFKKKKINLDQDILSIHQDEDSLVLVSSQQILYLDPLSIKIQQNFKFRYKSGDYAFNGQKMVIKDIKNQLQFYKVKNGKFKRFKKSKDYYDIIKIIDNVLYCSSSNELSSFSVENALSIKKIILKNSMKDQQFQFLKSFNENEIWVFNGNLIQKYEIRGSYHHVKLLKDSQQTKEVTFDALQKVEFYLDREDKLTIVQDSQKFFIQLQNSAKFFSTAQNFKFLYACLKEGNIQIYNIQKQQLVDQISCTQCLAMKLNSSQDILLTVTENNYFQMIQLPSKKTIVYQKLTDEKIVSFCFDDFHKKFFYSDSSGQINQLTINNNKITIESLLQLSSPIKCMSLSGENLILCTKSNKIYLYDVLKKFNFGLIKSLQKEVQDLLIKNQNVFLIDLNGTLNILPLKTIPQTIQAENESNQPIKSVFLTNKFCGVLRVGYLELWASSGMYPLLSREIDQSFIKILNINNDQIVLIDQSHKLLFLDLMNLEEKNQLNLENVGVRLAVLNQQGTQLVTLRDDYTLNCENLETNSLLFSKIIHEDIKNIFYVQDTVLCLLVNGQIKQISSSGQENQLIGKPSKFLINYQYDPTHNIVYFAYKEGLISKWDTVYSEVIDQYELESVLIYHSCFNIDKNIGNFITKKGEMIIMNLINGNLFNRFQLDDSLNCIKIHCNQDLIILQKSHKIYYYKSTLLVGFKEKKLLEKMFLQQKKINRENEIIKYMDVMGEELKTSELFNRHFNPFLACAIFNYQKCVQFILRNDLIDYPTLNSNFQASPLILALILGHLNIAQSILKFISRNPEDTYLTQKEITELMNYKYDFTHQYLIHFLVKLKKFTGQKTSLPLLSKLDEKIRMDHRSKPHINSKIFQEISLPSSIYYEDQGEGQDNTINTGKQQTGQSLSTLYSKTESKFKESENESIFMGGSDLKNIKSVKSYPWKSTYFLRVNGVYSFEEGSPESIKFLQNFINSPEKAFIMSYWNIIIDYKWKKLYRHIIPPASINWLHCLFFTLFMLYSNENFLMYFDIFLIFLMSIYEYFSLQTSGFFVYIKTINNILDLICTVYCFIILLLTKYYEQQQLQYHFLPLEIAQVIALLVLFFRSLTYLRIFKTFRHVINMIIGITKSSISLLFLSLFIAIMFAVTGLKSTNSNLGYFKQLQIQYMYMLGEIQDIDDSYNFLNWFLFVFQTLFVVLILMNFVIAKMSSKYEELEELEQVTAYREKAKLVLEVEYLYRIFGWYLGDKQERGEKKGFLFIAVNPYDFKNLHKDQDQEDSSHSIEDTISLIAKMVKQQSVNQENQHQIISDKLKIMQNEIKDLKNEVDNLQTQHSSFRESIKVNFVALEKENSFIKDKVIQNQKIHRKIEIIEKKLSQKSWFN